MTAHTTNQPTEFRTGLRAKLSAFFARLGQNMQQSMELHARMDQVTALQNKSDAELEKLGISRSQIPYYVFRDKAWF